MDCPVFSRSWLYFHRVGQYDWKIVFSLYKNGGKSDWYNRDSRLKKKPEEYFIKEHGTVVGALALRVFSGIRTRVNSLFNEALSWSYYYLLEKKVQRRWNMTVLLICDWSETRIRKRLHYYTTLLLRSTTHRSERQIVSCDARDWPAIIDYSSKLVPKMWDRTRRKANHSCRRSYYGCTHEASFSYL